MTSMHKKSDLDFLSLRVRGKEIDPHLSLATIALLDASKNYEVCY